jgi:hypothetical protein
VAEVSTSDLPPPRPMVSARVYGVFATLGGVAVIAEGLLLGYFGWLVFLLEALSDAPKSGGPDWAKALQILLGMLVSGALAIVWGIRMMWRRQFGIVGLFISLLFTAAVFAVALIPIDFFRTINIPLGIGMLGCAAWWACEDGPDGWHRSWQRASSGIGEICAFFKGPSPESKARAQVEKMVKSLKGGRDRKKDRDIESWE